MMRIFFALFFLCSTLFADDSELYSRLHEEMKAFMKQCNFTEGAIAIAKDGEVLSTAQYGKMQVDKVIPIASLSKVFTKWAIKDLIKQQVLSEDTLITSFFNITKPRDKRVHAITIKDVLSHKGGWKIARGSDPLFNMGRYRNKRFTPETFSEYFLTNFRLKTTPGTEICYCNAGYIILGTILEKLTQTDYFKYIKDTIADPLNITLEEAKTPSRVNYYSLELSKASFGLSSSTYDLAKAFSLFREEWSQTGSLPGMITAAAYRHPSGVTVVALIPERREGSWLRDCRTLRAAFQKVLRSHFNTGTVDPIEPIP